MISTSELFNPLALTDRAPAEVRNVLMRGLLIEMSGQRATVAPMYRDTFEVLRRQLPRATRRQHNYPTLLLPLPGHQEEEFLDIEYQLDGERFQVMGEVRRIGQRSYLAVCEGDYLHTRRRLPVVLQCFSLMLKLNLSVRDAHLLCWRWPPSLLMRGVAACCTASQKRHVSAPDRYIQSVMMRVLEASA